MTDKPIVQNAMSIAENVARIIFETSYKDKNFDMRVHDLLLFGSVFTGESFKSPSDQVPHDIDILVVHNLWSLREYGMFTRYDKKTRQKVFHSEADIAIDRYRPNVILEDMGSELAPHNYEVRRILLDGDGQTKGLSQKIGTLKQSNMYGGIVELPLVRKVDIPIKRFDSSREGFEHIHEYVNSAFDEKVGFKFTVNRVKSYLEQQGLPIDPTLDLIVMHKDLLDPSQAQEDRDLALQQSKDPTFWNSILVTGRLHNQSTGKFDIRVDQKYSGGTELFKSE
jgi:hypothetical protein